MGKVRKWLLVIATGVLLFVGVYFMVNQLGDEVPEDQSAVHAVMEIETNIVYSVEENQIGEYADLIVLGVPQDEFADRKFVINHFPKDANDQSVITEAIQDFYSFVNFKIDAVYKNDGVKIEDEISIFERAALITDAEGEKLIKMAGYQELKPQQKYVLFLKKSPEADYYHIVRNNDGQAKISTEQEVEPQVQAILKKHHVE